MEFIFELLFEIFGEILIQIVFQALAEVGLHFFRRPDAAPKPKSPWMLGIGYAVLGVIVGGISLWLHPASLIHSSLGRVANLVLGPIAAGLAMALIGAWRQRQGQQLLGLDRFSYGFIFALAAGLVRFYGAA